jgi:acetoin utilization deacetylase AcuC-like enzyme
MKASPAAPGRPLGGRAEPLLEALVEARAIGRRGLARAASWARDLGLPLPPPARLVFDEDYVGPTAESDTRHAFDGRRPLRIVERLRRSGVLSRTQLLRPSVPSAADLARVHPAAFLAELRQPERLAALLALPVHTIQLQDDPLLPFLLQSGGTMLALEHALRHALPVFNLGGGFHHAQRDRAEGFCPLNDLALAIERVRALRLARRILVVDLDYHHGNGTALIYAEDEEVFTLSLHGQAWAQLAGKRHNLDLPLPAGTGDGDYLAALRETLPPVLRRFRPQAAIYLAGADVSAADQLGDFRLSEDGVLERDLYVAHCLRAAHVPFAVVLGGGYGPFAWTLPYNFIYSVLTGTRIPLALRPSNVAAQYARVRTALGPIELRQGTPALAASDGDALLGLERGESSLFMGTYSREGLVTVLERYGFLELLCERGFAAPLISIDTEDPDRQVLRIHDGQPDPAHLLIELVTRYRALRRPASAAFAPDGLRLLAIEWLCMQNPCADFTLDRPQLPDQRFPGLGLGPWMLELLRQMALRLRCAGLMNCPRHYHNARVYARAMRFFDPAIEGRFRALQALLEPLPLLEAIDAVARGAVVDEEGLPWHWTCFEGAPQVLATDEALSSYLASAAYQRAVSEARAGQRLRLLQLGG